MKATVMTILLSAIVFLTGCANGTNSAHSSPEASASSKTLEIGQAFLEAAGMGNMEKMSALMSDDFAWNNEGDPEVPWIGKWQGKNVVLKTFLPTFGAGLAVTGWETDYSFANGDQAVFMGTMSANASSTGQGTGTFSWAVRVHVVDNKVKSWNWVENSYAVSKAYHGQ